jgi:hypothetical protein
MEWLRLIDNVAGDEDDELTSWSPSPLQVPLKLRSPSPRLLGRGRPIELHIYDANSSESFEIVIPGSCQGN